MIDTLWYTVLSEREASEVELALDYALTYNHGTSGHLSYLVIAKLAKLVEYISDGSEPKEELKAKITKIGAK